MMLNLDGGHLNHTPVVQADIRVVSTNGELLCTQRVDSNRLHL